MALHTRILLALLAGAVCGLTANGLTAGTGARPTLEAVVSNLAEPVGRMWLSALIMVVIPLIVSTLALGVAGLGSVRRLGRIGVLTMLCFLGLTAASASLGLLVMNTVRPGYGLDPPVCARAACKRPSEARGAEGHLA